MKDLKVYVTLWPSFPHFPRFAMDQRLQGIRLNSAMMSPTELDEELGIIAKLEDPIPLYFDVKGRQLRVVDDFTFPDHLELEINHPIKVKTPVIVDFKAGSDHAKLIEIRNGTRLIFEGGPHFLVKPGESISIRDKDCVVEGPLFTEQEIIKMAKVRKSGIDKYFLSFVEHQRDIDEFREHVGDADIVAKIENVKGLRYVAKEFKPQDNLTLMAARGDMYVELGMPHEILAAMKLIISKDSRAFAGSRFLLSLVPQPMPECCDFSDLAWCYDIGYKKLMLCDELCLKEPMLARAVNVMESFRTSYCDDERVSGLWGRLASRFTGGALLDTI